MLKVAHKQTKNHGSIEMITKFILRSFAISSPFKGSNFTPNHIHLKRSNFTPSHAPFKGSSFTPSDVPFNFGMNLSAWLLDNIPFQVMTFNNLRAHFIPNVLFFLVLGLINVSAVTAIY